MSYGIDEGIADVVEKLRLMKRIREMFPKASMDSLADGSQAWFTNDEDIEANGVSLCVGRDGVAYLYRFTLVDEGNRRSRIFINRDPARVDTVLERLSQDEPETYEKLVAYADEYWSK